MAENNAAAANQDQRLPLFYNSLAPLNSQMHPDHGLKPRENFAYARGTHAVPLTVDEFALAQRFYPIVFGMGPNPAPLALMGLNEGVNLFIDENGKWRDGAYVPAYIRRYPFMLAKLTPDAKELSLCFDDSSDLIVANEGDRLFNDAQPSDTTKAVLAFCEQFEQAIARTRAFMAEIEKLDLVIDGEVALQQPGMAQPAVYRGFRMIAEEKLQNIRGDQARKMVQNGMMGLIYAHLFSLGQVRDLFEQQVGQANANAPAPEAANA